MVETFRGEKTALCRCDAGEGEGMQDYRVPMSKVGNLVLARVRSILVNNQMDMVRPHGRKEVLWATRDENMPRRKRSHVRWELIS